MQHFCSTLLCREQVLPGLSHLLGYPAAKTGKAELDWWSETTAAYRKETDTCSVANTTVAAV